MEKFTANYRDKGKELSAVQIWHEIQDKYSTYQVKKQLLPVEKIFGPQSPGAFFEKGPRSM